MSTPDPTSDSRALVVGSEHACDRLIRQLRAIDESQPLVGVVLTETTTTDRIADLPVLGGLDDLVALCASHAVTSAIVTLPASDRALWRTISVSLHRAGVIERFVPPMDELLHSAPVVTSSNAVTIAPPRSTWPSSLGVCLTRSIACSCRARSIRRRSS